MSNEKNSKKQQLEELSKMTITSDSGNITTTGEQIVRLFKATLSTNEYEEYLQKEIRPTLHKDSDGKFKPTTDDELRALCYDLSVHLGDIDTSAIADMSDLFWDSERTDFSGIEGWDTSKVTDMSRMFCGAKHFNADISGWDTSKVTDMRYMFNDAESFNQILDSWNVSSIPKNSDHSFMFDNSLTKIPKWYYDLNRDSYWEEFERDWAKNEDIKRLKNEIRPKVLKNSEGKYIPIDKEQLQSLLQDESVHLGDIDTSKITDMSRLFMVHCGNITRKDFSGIDKWNVSNVKDMEYMFYDIDNFNENINDLDVSNVENMACMFNFTKFNQPLDKWNVSNVKDMGGMFAMSDFDKDLSAWGDKLGKVVSMSSMFCGAQSFNQPLDSWDVSNVVDMGEMFECAYNFNQDLSDWGDKLGKVRNMDNMFDGTISLIIDFLSVWNIPEYCSKECMTMASGLETADKSKLKPSKLKPKECNYTITQISKECNIDEKFRIDTNNKRRFLGEWIPHNIFEKYNVFLAKAPPKKDNNSEHKEHKKHNNIEPKKDKQNKKSYSFDDIEQIIYDGNYDEWEWDFAIYEVFGYKFVVEKGDKILECRKVGNSFGIQIKDTDKATDKQYNANTKFYDNNLSISFSNQLITIWIKKGSNQKDILDILNIFIIAKAYNTKMDELGKIARSANDERVKITQNKRLIERLLPFSASKRKNKEVYTELKKSYEKVCNFDLHSYHTTPIEQVDKSALIAIWKEISIKYMVQSRHDELKETIASITQLVSGERQERLNYIIVLGCDFIGYRGDIFGDTDLQRFNRVDCK